MEKKGKLTKTVILPLTMLGFFLIFALVPSKVQAAGLAKPKLIKKSCTFANNKVCLAWKKVKGAKKYQIFRAKVNPKTGKIGKWSKWTTTKKRSIKKKGTGDFRYRIRAIRGKKAGKWSKSVRIFAATGQITHLNYVEPEILFGVTLHSGRIEMRVLVTNKTKSPMGFLESGSRIPTQGHLYAIDKASGKVLKVWETELDTGSIYGIAKQVNPGKAQSVYFYSFVEPEEWAAYNGCKFMITNSFYPNPTVEPMSTQMALTCTGYAKDSAIAGK